MNALITAASAPIVTANPRTMDLMLILSMVTLIVLVIVVALTKGIKAMVEVVLFAVTLFFISWGLLYLT